MWMWTMGIRKWRGNRINNSQQRDFDYYFYHANYYIYNPKYLLFLFN